MAGGFGLDSERENPWRVVLDSIVPSGSVVSYMIVRWRVGICTVARGHSFANLEQRHRRIVFDYVLPSNIMDFAARKLLHITGIVEPL